MPYLIALFLLISNLGPSTVQESTQSPAQSAPQTGQPSKQELKRPTPGTGKSESNPPRKKPEQNAEASKPNPAPAEPPVANPEAEKSESVTTNTTEKPDTKTPSEWWTIGLTGALVFLGLCQLIAMIVYVCWMIKSVGVARQSADAAKASADAASATVNTMKDTAGRQLRAYVHPVTALRYRDETGVLVIKLEIKNAGQTPAYECSHWMVEGVHTGFPAPPEAFTNKNAPKGDSPIAPGESVDFFVSATELTPAQEAQIAAKIAAIYLFGEITYRDAFQTERVTKFRLVCVGDLIRTGRFAPCDEGNDAT